MAAVIRIRTTATTDRQFMSDLRFAGTTVTAFIIVIIDTIGTGERDYADFFLRGRRVKFPPVIFLAKRF
jgi:hypothetical protein